MFLDEITSLDIERLSALEVADNLHKVLNVRALTPDTFVLRLERKNIEFKAGQHMQIKLPGYQQFRYYTIYSGTQQPFLEFLIKEIPNGSLTPLLKRVKANDYLELRKPKGSYILREQDLKTKNFLFLASGTGIAPFHSFSLSHPNLKYHLIHGIRHSSEAYEKTSYNSQNITICATADNFSNFKGRITKYLEINDLSAYDLFYLCGNSLMITDAIEILEGKSIKPEQIFVESYF